MELTQKTREGIEQFADEALYQFNKISTAAKEKLRDHSPGADALATINTITAGPAIQKLGQISQANQESYKLLEKEPAIARVVVIDEDGKKLTYYICRTSPVSGFTNLASYRAPVGRLAELSVGSEHKLPNGTMVEVLERAQLRPLFSPDGWDSKNTVIESDDFGSITIESLRVLLYGTTSEETQDLLGQLLAEEGLKANIIEGVRRSVITKMGLRDQPVLDQYQGEIFRLPLDKRLLILGPPGTGKTTTLIRRIGQKLDTEILDSDEKRLIEKVSATQGLAHENSWLMFTPTELLRQYLKEAFAREGIPAPDDRIRTWHDYRRHLARNTFGVIKNAAGVGTFVLKEAIQILSHEALTRCTEWFDDFDYWQRVTFVTELLEAAKRLSEAKPPEIQGLGHRLNAILERASADDMTTIFVTLATEVPYVQALVASIKDASDSKIKRSLNFQINRNRAFLDELAGFIDGLQQALATDFDEQDDIESEYEDGLDLPRTGPAAAYNAYMRAVRAHARATASKRMPGKSSLNGKIIEWLGDRTLAEEDRIEIGIGLLIQASARCFANPVRRYFHGIPKRYRAFRRLRQEEGTWYRSEGFEPKDIHSLELDGVLLAILRSAGDLMNRPDVLQNIKSPAWSSLEPIRELYLNQVLADEATDFSPIQLACMGALAHPMLRSFFACGDFNQRLTTWGARSADELKWVFPDLDLREITVTYRHSKQLNELACGIIHALGGTERRVSLPAHMDTEGVPPALLESASEMTVVVSWLSNRIREIEHHIRQLPSTAIFVNSENEVKPFAEALNAALAEYNIQVVACLNGRAVGQDNDIRVFDIQHIKGLEFEAVFFVAIDRLAELHPELFGQYLYVGATRAATYLGITCEQALPVPIETLRNRFTPGWQIA